MPSRPMMPTSMLGLLVPLATTEANPDFDEIDLVDALLALLERLSYRKIDGFEMRFE